MPTKKKPDYSDEAELRLLQKLGHETFGLSLEEIVHSGAEANLMGLKTEHTTFSRRLDSRTYFAHDTRYGIGRANGVFRGSDKEYFKVCRGVLKQLKIPLAEVASQVLLKEQTQVASVDHRSGKIVKEPVEDGKYFARLTRKVAGVPVWSSGMVLGLAANQRIGYLQLHWPDITPAILREAQCLAHKVANGWTPPQQPGASVESVEAGVVHSPPIGFFLDTIAAIRVIYQGESGVHRQKPMYFFDRHGKPVAVPRQIEHPAPEQRERKSTEKPPRH